MNSPPAAAPDGAKLAHANASAKRIDGPAQDAVPGSAAHPPPDDIDPADIPIPETLQGPDGLRPDPDALAAAQPGGPDAATLAATNLRPLPARPLRRTLNARQRRLEQILRWTKQSLIDRFAHWHMGLRHWNAWDEARRAPTIAQIPIPPRPGRWPGHPRVTRGTRLPRLHRVEAEPGPVMRGLRRAVPMPRRPREVRADVVRRRLGPDFQVAGWKFKRRLGMGGFGAVFLFDLISERGQRLPVVVKGGLGGGDSLYREIENIALMSGASHFIQRIILSSLPLPSFQKRARWVVSDTLSTVFSRLGIGNTSRPPVPPTSSPRDWNEADVVDIQRKRQELDERRDIVILENMPRGSVQDLIAKLRRRGKGARLSDRTLWMIFECLFKGCLAMAYPTSFWTPGRNPWIEPMYETDERVPDEYLGRGPNHQPLVHFDLDPQNALIGDFGMPGDDHDLVPIFKIADPGLGRTITDRFQNDELKLWLARHRGKSSWYHPEQFTHEWDYNASIDLKHLMHEPTAGNWQWSSNLYQVGWIMWSLITLCYPPQPPLARPYLYDAEGNNDATGGWTYGMDLMSPLYGEYDYDLRAQVLRCLDHDATRRPDIEWLEQVIGSKVWSEQLVRAESDDQLREAVAAIFGSP